jgi:hypothetical protein
MKLNKIEVVSKTSVTDLEGVSSLSDTHIQLRYMTDDGGWHRTSMPIESGNIDDLPDLSADEKALVQSICDEACKVPETSNIQRMDFYCSPTHIKMDANGAKEYIPEARFAKLGIRYKNKGNDELKTCDCEVPADAKGFHDACFNHKAGLYKEVHKLMQLKDEPDYQATETIEVTEEVTEVIGDKAVVKKVTKTVEIPLTDEIPCVDEDGNGICDICNTTHEKFPIVKPKMIQVPRMIEGKKVSEEDKARLAELLGNL